MDASIQSHQRQNERYEDRLQELQALVQAQEQKLAEVPHYLERMRQAKEVCRFCLLPLVLYAYLIPAIWS